jgi:hypothetical protein
VVNTESWCSLAVYEICTALESNFLCSTNQNFLKSKIKMVVAYHGVLWCLDVCSTL